MSVCIVLTLLSLVVPAVSLYPETDTALGPGHLTIRDSEPPPQLQAVAAKQECPTWFVGNRSRGCECHDVPGVVCQTNHALVLTFSCVTYDMDGEQLQAAGCPFSIALDKTDYVNNFYIKLPDKSSDVNDYFCAGLNRTSVACSKCQTGLGPPVLSYSFKCVQCLPSPYGWLLYIFLASFPTAVLSLLVFLFQVRVNSPQLNIVVLACQLLALLQVSSFRGTRDSISAGVTTFYSLWNLEYFRYAIPPFCVSESLSLVDVYVLEYLVATFPLFLILVIYVSVELHARGCKVLVCLWKPFRICCARTRRWMDPRGSIVNVFATLLMLSYTKLVIISVGMLHYTQIFSNGGESVGPRRVCLDASMHYCSLKYLPYLVLSSSVLCFFVVLPILFLCLYPLRPFQRCLNTCGLSWHALHAFADSFNGHYKNRTDNTFDCRYFGSFYLILRIVIFVSCVLSGRYLSLVQITTGVVALFLLSSLRPYKNEIFNIIDSFFIGVWIISVLVVLYDSHMIATIPLSFYYVVGILPLTYLIVLVMLHLLVRTKLYRRYFLNFHKVRNLIERFVGYQSRDNRGTEANRSDGGFAHRLVHPAQYRPVGYGTVAS